MVTINTPKISEDWLEHLNTEFQQPYFKNLKTFLLEEKKTHTIYPTGDNMLRALSETPLSGVKVVIIGQDPYHGEFNDQPQANGLSFSVNDGVKHPPSLQNIFKELNTDIAMPPPEHGNLEKWAKQGVLMLNATLSVRKKTPGSHQKKGWEQFTDAIIQTISSQTHGVVFLLWGKYAQDKAARVDETKHTLLKAPHPSPFSAHKGFFGCKHFSQTNAILTAQGKEPIDWALD